VVTRGAHPGPGGDPAGEHEHLQLTTLAGWRRLVTERPSVPDLLPEAIWPELEDDKRACYDDDRIDHHSRLLVVQTPAIRQVITSGRRLVQLNKNARHGRCGLMVSGPARTGKTTALTQLGKTTEVIHRRRYPRSASDIPVLYITVARGHPEDDRDGVRPVPRPPALPPGQHHRRDRVGLRREPGRPRHPGHRRFYRPLPQLFLMSVRLACRDVP
jgi:hypothetical protein